jgi:hypothetical protein
MKDRDSRRMFLGPNEWLLYFIKGRQSVVEEGDRKEEETRKMHK